MSALNTSLLDTLPPALEPPTYDRDTVTAGIVHIGIGHFHRAHQAMYLDHLLREGDGNWAIWGVSMRADAATESFAAQDHLYTLTEKHPDGTKQTRVIGSIIGFDSAADGTSAVLERLADTRTRIVTLTVTEGGYGIDHSTGLFSGVDDPAITADLAQPGSARSWLGLLVAAFRLRKDQGSGPVTVLSCDNIQDNGSVTREAVLSFATRVAPDLLEWIQENVTFPGSMVDRVVPGTTDADREYLRDAFDLEDSWAVTAEPFSQWVVEDRFAGGRPALEKAGVNMVSDVAPYERMKLRLANGVHQALCFFGRLLNHEYVHEAIADPDIHRLLIRYVDEQAVPSLEPIPGVDFRAWGRTVISRFGNPQLGDPVARITAETSDRIPKFVLPVVTDLVAMGHDTSVCAAIIASWARYAQGTDEQGAAIIIKDPRAAKVEAAARADLDDPGVFLDQDLFGGLSTDPGFRTAFIHTRTALNADGARIVLQRLAVAAPAVGAM
ncbi:MULTISPECIES: mannitol dehydrogenase family protein [unclassified Microbacterium]|uniref:mannitol dehydrogenase family protein n=1 Tax=unclassified Microbacterium TaxID=2609290 RepID=UPI003660A770